jgi:hypothetical protein
MRKLTVTLVALVAVLGLSVLSLHSADYPARAIHRRRVLETDQRFLRTGRNFSIRKLRVERSVVSNVLPELTKRVKPGGVYLGVAPEQNFTYMSALQSKLGFIIDIRRQKHD